MKARWALLSIGAATLVTQLLTGSPARATADAGTAPVVLSEAPAAAAAGGSATSFALDLPKDAACRGDSADDGYRVQSFMIPADVDPASLEFGSQGPKPQATGTAFRQPLYATTSSPFVNEHTANVDEPTDLAVIVDVPSFNLAVFKLGDIPPGAYAVGLACTKGTGKLVVDRHWKAVLDVRALASDLPAGVSWTARARAATAATAGETGRSGSGATASRPSIQHVNSSEVDAGASAGTGAAVASRVVAERKPTGGPPSFSIPAFGLLSWSLVTEGSPAAFGWLLVIAATGRILFVSLRQPVRNPAPAA